MKLEQQVVSLDIAKRLKELGVKQYQSIFQYQRSFLVLVPVRDGKGIYAAEGTDAFTVAELGEMLPKNENLVTMFFPNGHCQICLQGNVENDDGIATRWGAAGQSIEADTEADARGKMLIYLLEQGLLPAIKEGKK